MDAYAVPGKLRIKKKGKKDSLALPASISKKHNPYIPLAKQIQDALVKDKLERKSERQSVEEAEDSTRIEAEPTAVAPRKTKAEIAFAKRQEELQKRRVLEKAKTSHREKVEKFNHHMETMTEFNDIPKVSWTK